MKKPKKKPMGSYYSLLEVLDYVEEIVTGFHREMWCAITDGGINNDSFAYICFEEFEENESQIVNEGIRVLYEQFPDVERDGEEFYVSW